MGVINYWVLVIIVASTFGDRVPRILNYNVDETPLETKLGLIIGKIEASMSIEADGSPLPGKKYFAFRGIPYARPPVGSLRWEEPVRPAPWQETLSAATFGPSCLQYSRITDTVVGQEDCLYLNVYTPFLPKIPGGPNLHSPGFRSGQARSADQHRRVNRKTLQHNRRFTRHRRQIERRLLPVIVFIHGGQFVEGNSNLYGPEKMMREEIVLVTFNYRLGVLGFLSTGDNVLPGNYGLADQILLLKWVKDNIDDYGGNPHQVTLMGQEAGGASVNYLMMSPRAEGLFSQVIIQSGSALCDWALELDPNRYADLIAGTFNCDHTKSGHLVDCLRGGSGQDLIMAQTRLMSLGSLPINTVPVVDRGNRTEPFVPDHPEILMAESRFSPKPVVTGVTTDEGFSMFMRAYLRETAVFQNEEDLKEHFLDNILTLYLNNNEEHLRLGRAITHYYFSGVEWNDPQQYIEAFTRMLSDLTVVSCQKKMVSHLTSKNSAPVFTYVFDYRDPGSPTWSFLEILYAQETKLNLEYFYRVVSQGDELSYLFLIETSHPTGPSSLQDNKFSAILTRMWGRFASVGSPTLLDTPVSEGRYIWTPTSRKVDLTYNLTFNPSSPMIRDYKRGESLFWSETLPYITHLSGWLTWMERWRYDVLFWIFLCLFLIAIAVIVGLLILLRKKHRSGNYPEIAGTRRKSSQL